jgi:hypothetical protein
MELNLVARHAVGGNARPSVHHSSFELSAVLQNIRVPNSDCVGSLHGVVWIDRGIGTNRLLCHHWN